jgi:hypothetical protein
MNVGVGVYNAFQLHKIGKQLDKNHEQVQAYFGSIQNTLNAHQRTLEILVCSQYNLSQQMNILREEMRSGFEKVVQEIQDAEASRRRREFYANTYELLEAYGRFTDHLPDLPEADQLINRAERLEALLQAELSQIQSGRPERLSLVIALAFSVRAKADAFEAKGGNYIISADKALNKLKQQICQEAYATCENKSLYVLGVEIPEILYQYSLLKRSIDKGIELRSNSESEFTYFPDELIWNDGLDELRNIFENSPDKASENPEKINEKTPIALNTLGEYEWYVRFSGKNRSTFNVHSIKTISLIDILKRIGHPKPETVEIFKNDLDKLRLFALPETPGHYLHCMQKEFAWKECPQLSGAIS